MDEFLDAADCPCQQQYHLHDLMVLTYSIGEIREKNSKEEWKLWKITTAPRCGGGIYYWGSKVAPSDVNGPEKD